MRQNPDQVRIISGRDVAELQRLLGLDEPPELWGCHGWQRRYRSGRQVGFELSETAACALREAEHIAEAEDCVEHLERKPYSLAVHWRGVSKEKRLRLQRLVVRPWQELSNKSELVLLPFDGGAELRCPGVTKGTVVEHILQEFPRGVAAAYLGDDLTDEDAFAALGEGGLKVLVRPRLRDTAADLWLQPPEELLWFLGQWRKAREETNRWQKNLST